MGTTKRDSSGFLGVIAMIAIIAIALSLLSSKIFSGATASLIYKIVRYGTYIVLGVISFYYCSSKTNQWWLGIWTAAVIIIIVSLFL